MERTVTQHTLVRATAVNEAGFRPRVDLRRLRPLWRYAVFTMCLFSVTAFAVAVRIDVQQLRKDLDRNGRMQREAGILHDRLQLEMDARRRAAAMEVVARRLNLGTAASVVRLEAGNE